MISVPGNFFFSDKLVIAPLPGKILSIWPIFFSFHMICCYFIQREIGWQNMRNKENIGLNLFLVFLLH